MSGGEKQPSRATYYRRRKQRAEDPNLAPSDSDLSELSWDEEETAPQNLSRSNSSETADSDSNLSSDVHSVHSPESVGDVAASPASEVSHAPSPPSTPPQQDLDDIHAGVPIANADEMSDHEQEEFAVDDDDEWENLVMDDDIQEEILHPNRQGLPGHDPPLYAGAPITLGQSLLAILTYSIVHNLSGVALADLLSLVALHCIANNNVCKKTLYTFKRYFQNLNSPIVYHFYCSNCMVELQSKDDHCPHDLCANAEVNYFLEVSIIAQLASMYKRENFVRDLNFRFNHVKKHVNNFEDIYDGRVYQDKVQEGFLQNASNISFLWNTDGVRVFKSAKLELWPVYLAINELPYKQRFKKENMVVAGLWFGSSKPSPGLFFSAFHRELTDLHNGVDFQVPDGNIGSVHVRATVLCGTCDTPAKSHFLNIIGHNGYYGCPKCKNRGERSDRTSDHHAYPCDLEAQLRTDAETEEHAQLAEQYNISVFGVKGFSALRLYVQNYITSTSVDIMHLAWQGVVKTLMELWFDPKYRDFNFSLIHHTIEMEDLLRNITPPSFVTRLPRSVSEHLSYWKASEFKTWIYYYSVPVLATIMNAEYLDHHLLLVHALFVLNSDSVSGDTVAEAEACLSEYVMRFQHLYGLRFLTINFHMLLHLADNVRNLGPLWATSCMPFEDMNGQLVRLVHGTRYTSLQITSSMSQLVNLPILLAKLDLNDPVRRWCQRLQERGRVVVNEDFGNSVSSVGRYVHLPRVPPVIQNALIDAGIIFGNVCQFFKLKKGACLLYSESYNRALRTCSSCVEFLHENNLKCGIINNFVRVSECQCNEVCRCRADLFAIITVLDCESPFRTIHPAASLKYIKDAVRTNNIIAVSVHNLGLLCFNVRVGNKTYIINPVNTLEAE